MDWRRFWREFGLGLVVMAAGTSAAIVPPTALPALLAEVDRSQQIGILVIYGALFVSVVAYAFESGRRRPEGTPARR